MISSSKRPLPDAIERDDGELTEEIGISGNFEMHSNEST